MLRAEAPSSTTGGERHQKVNVRRSETSSAAVHHSHDLIVDQRIVAVDGLGDAALEVIAGDDLRGRVYVALSALQPDTVSVKLYRFPLLS